MNQLRLCFHKKDWVLSVQYLSVRRFSRSSRIYALGDLSKTNSFDNIQYNHVTRTHSMPHRIMGHRGKPTSNQPLLTPQRESLGFTHTLVHLFICCCCHCCCCFKFFLRLLSNHHCTSEKSTRTNQKKSCSNFIKLCHSILSKSRQLGLKNVIIRQGVLQHVMFVK